MNSEKDYEKNIYILLYFLKAFMKDPQSKL